MQLAGDIITHEICHCGQPAVYRQHADYNYCPFDIACSKVHYTRGMCEHCDSVRCDAYPGNCGRKNND